MEHVDLDEPEHDRPDGGVSVDFAVHLASERRLLEAALRDLPQEYRRVIELRHYSHLSFPEIGRSMERTTDAVWMLHKRAKAALARAMDALRKDGRERP